MAVSWLVLAFAFVTLNDWSSLPQDRQGWSAAWYIVMHGWLEATWFGHLVWFYSAAGIVLGAPIALSMARGIHRLASYHSDKLLQDAIEDARAEQERAREGWRKAIREQEALEQSGQLMRKRAEASAEARLRQQMAEQLAEAEATRQVADAHYAEAEERVEEIASKADKWKTHIAQQDQSIVDLKARLDRAHGAINKSLKALADGKPNLGYIKGQLKKGLR